MTLRQLKRTGAAILWISAALWDGSGKSYMLLPPPLAGARVFPVLPGDKIPALDYGWQIRATNDAAQIAQWEGGMKNLNWGIAAGPSGLFVFDVDPNGLSAWDALLARDPLLKAAVARAFTVQTPRGGFHIYFRGQGPTTVKAIAEGIDTRGGYLDERTGKMKSVGYVVAPGSRTVAGKKTIDGEYRALGGVIEDMPAAVLAIVPERKRGVALGLETPVEPDNPRNVRWATDLLENYVKEGRVSVEGNGGDDTCFKVVASVLDKGLSAQKAYELLNDLWNPHCSPPWEDWEIEKKILNALEYGEDTGAGAKGFQDNATAFANFQNYVVAPELLAGAETEKHRGSRFKPMWLRDARKDKREASWLIPGLLPARGVGILYGLSGSFKTFIALDWALSLAHGIPGQWNSPPVKNPVVFCAGESRYALQQERVDAWCEWRGVDPDDGTFILVPGVPAYGDKEGWTEIRDGIAEMGVRPSLVAIDTLTRVQTGMDENSNDDQKMILKMMEELSDHYGCFTLMTAHTGKDESRGIRGAQVLVDNSDAVIMARKTKGGTSLTVKKLKEVDIPDTPYYFEKKEFGKSIVLVKTDKAPDDVPSRGPSKISWSDPVEISRRVANAGGEIGMGPLVADLCAEFHVEKSVVMRELKKREDIQWMRVGDHDWRVPVTQEFDL